MPFRNSTLHHSTSANGLNTGRVQPPQSGDISSPLRLHIVSALINPLKLLVSLGVDLLGLLLGSLSSNVELGHDPVPSSLGILSDLSENGPSGRRCAVLEVRPLATGKSAELVEVGSLGNGLRNVLARDMFHKNSNTYHSVAVKVSLELTVAPRVKGRSLCAVGSLGEVAGSRSIRGAASRRGRGISRLSGLDKVLASSAGLLTSLLRGLIARSGQIGLQVVVREIVKGPRSPARGGLVGVLADQGTELISLGSMGDGLQNCQCSSTRVGLGSHTTPRASR